MADRSEKDPSVWFSSSTSYSVPVRTPSQTTTLSSKKEVRDATVPSSPMSSSAFTIDGGTGSVPEPAGTYMIREVESGKAITLVNGRLTLVRDAGTRGGWQWHCEEQDDGWLGFRDAVSGKYLGHDNRDGFRVQASKHLSWESFILRPREAGGYNLLVKDGNRLRAMAVTDADKMSPRLLLASNAKEGARWEFVEV